jgi:hypothetical protein
MTQTESDTRLDRTDPQAIAEFDRAEIERVAKVRADQQASLAGPQVWTTSASSQYPQTTCAINASAIAFNQLVLTPQGYVQTVLVQTNADIHNPYVFVGVKLGVYVDLVDGDGAALNSVYHEASAGAVFDPAGNNRSYSWVDTVALPDVVREQVSGVRIRFTNVS